MLNRHSKDKQNTRNLHYRITNDEIKKQILSKNTLFKIR